MTIEGPRSNRRNHNLLLSVCRNQDIEVDFHFWAYVSSREARIQSTVLETVNYNTKKLTGWAVEAKSLKKKTGLLKHTRKEFIV